MRTVAVVVLAISVASGTAAARVDRHTYNAPPDKVFDAAVKTARAMGGAITVEDRVHGVLDCRVAYSTGKFSSMETPRGYTLHVTIESASGGKTLMSVDAREIGFNQASSLCRDCGKTTMGKTFIKRVGRVLKGKPPQGPVIVGGRIPLPER